ncbi:MAG TPA: hypothetical protein VF758_04600, partial [Candidatus Acidoferrum sp.]
MTYAQMIVPIFLLAAGLSAGTQAKTAVTRKSGGKLPDGTAVELYTLKSEKLEVQIINYGGDVVSIKVPDRTGKVEDVVLGFDDAAGYYENNHSKSASFFGPIVGRYANRIAHATFTLGGTKYTLPKNS